MSSVASASPVPFFREKLIRPRDSSVFQSVREGPRLAAKRSGVTWRLGCLENSPTLGKQKLVHVWLGSANNLDRLLLPIPDQILRYLLDKNTDPDMSYTAAMNIQKEKALRLLFASWMTMKKEMKQFQWLKVAGSSRWKPGQTQ
ncbi:unnamed protein product [Clonostachys solani]|uniref:Uncharacterized protein n=1 Tax=Clonostachys solani TaxID=160281 RepID=A0A9N9W640_9HYPO|nr:unnamed protein product [Clonostachys solani]